MTKVLVVATSRKTRGGITSVVKAHETGEQWTKYQCVWIQTHRDGATWRKILYFIFSLIQYIFLLPFYDIVHIHIATTASAKRKKWFYKFAKMVGKKIIFHFHPSNEKFLYEVNVANLYRELFGGADKVLVLSNQWKRWLSDALGEGVWMDKIDVLYNPCPIVNRDYCKKQKQILYAGTLLKRKGYDVLLKAFAKIAVKHPDWNVAFAGNPYLKEGINELEDGKRIARECGIECQVDWLGWVSGEEKEKVFNESSIYCLASDGEGFPMGVLDAWAYGIPCVVTPVGGIPDIVRDGVEGLIFPVGDVDALAIALDRLIESKELRESIVSATDEYVKKTFNVDIINHQLDEIYEKV
ncbi:MAG: glycosyltransferase family 4 protein [Bacteroidaceae bacterium]|nr:glycosyltransferase family 4 protein [Bacteroidaceae bacterium]